ncbi:acetoacetate-CoA ligase, partial [Vibrio parahaemolyticus EKP-008]
MSSPSGLKMSVTNDRPIRGNSFVMKSRVFNSGLGIVA